MAEDKKPPEHDDTDEEENDLPITQTQERLAASMEAEEMKQPGSTSNQSASSSKSFSTFGNNFECPRPETLDKTAAVTTQNAASSQKQSLSNRIQEPSHSNQKRQKLQTGKGTEHGTTGEASIPRKKRRKPKGRIRCERDKVITNKPSVNLFRKTPAEPAKVKAGPVKPIHRRTDEEKPCFNLNQNTTATKPSSSFFKPSLVPKYNFVWPRPPDSNETACLTPDIDATSEICAQTSIRFDQQPLTGGLNKHTTNRNIRNLQTNPTTNKQTQTNTSSSNELPLQVRSQTNLPETTVNGQYSLIQTGNAVIVNLFSHSQNAIPHPHTRVVHTDNINATQQMTGTPYTFTFPQGGASMVSQSIHIILQTARDVQYTSQSVQTVAQVELTDEDDPVDEGTQLSQEFP